VSETANLDWPFYRTPHFLGALLNTLQTLEQAAQGSGGVTIPGGVQKKCRFCTSGYGLVGMLVFG